jgi:hypothetical protein
VFNSAMAQKRAISFRLDPALAKRFQEATSPFFGKIGACFAASILMFLEADPKTQGEYVKKIYDAEISGDIEAAIQQAKSEQLKKIKSREDAPKSKRPA